jgi:hypothetical protein
MLSLEEKSTLELEEEETEQPWRVVELKKSECFQGPQVVDLQ